MKESVRTRRMNTVNMNLLSPTALFQTTKLSPSGLQGAPFILEFSLTWGN
jgi:hypothetical protein